MKVLSEETNRHNSGTVAKKKIEVLHLGTRAENYKLSIELCFGDVKQQQQQQHTKKVNYLNNHWHLSLSFHHA